VDAEKLEEVKRLHAMELQRNNETKREFQAIQDFEVRRNNETKREFAAFDGRSEMWLEKRMRQEP
jgi:DNA-binding TFAR19-related protein (PDSD5 family)